MSSREQVVIIICNELDVTPNQCTDDARLVHDLGADSLDAINLTMRFEEHFCLQIPDADAEKLTTVGEIVAYLDADAAKYQRGIADATGEAKG